MYIPTGRFTIFLVSPVGLNGQKCLPRGISVSPVGLNGQKCLPRGKNPILNIYYIQYKKDMTYARNTNS